MKEYLNTSEGIEHHVTLIDELALMFVKNPQDQRDIRLSGALVADIVNAYRDNSHRTDEALLAWIKTTPVYGELSKLRAVGDDDLQLLLMELKTKLTTPEQA